MKEATKKPAATAATKGAAAKTAPAKAPSAFSKPLTPSPELAAVVGGDALPRTEVVKKIWEYIKKHKLQNEANKKEIVADAKLKAVFGRRQGDDVRDEQVYQRSFEVARRASAAGMARGCGRSADDAPAPPAVSCSFVVCLIAVFLIAASLTCDPGPLDAAMAAPHGPEAHEASPVERAKRLVAAMTLNEKVDLVRSRFGMPLKGKPAPAGSLDSAGYVPGVPRLGIPPLQESDAGLGVANPTNAPFDATAMPSGLALAARLRSRPRRAGGAGDRRRGARHRLFRPARRRRQPHPRSARRP